MNNHRKCLINRYLEYQYYRLKYKVISVRILSKYVPIVLNIWILCVENDIKVYIIPDQVMKLFNLLKVI